LEQIGGIFVREMVTHKVILALPFLTGIWFKGYQNMQAK
jgi:hypothetical protein